MASGAVTLTLLLFVMRCAGVVFAGGPATNGRFALENGFEYAALFLTVGLAEETLWRGYALVNLAKAISFWPAMIVISALFGLSHLHHDEENYAGILSAMAFSAVLGWSFLRFGSLWFAIGVHAGWDFCQSFLYGVPDSGVVVPGSLMKLRLSGPVWLSGGSAGPEGSYLMVLVFAALILVVRQWGVPPPSRADGA
jgi:membrane protease YdiL (CAAX protease family)